MFWFAVLSIALLLCYKRRYEVTNAYAYSVESSDKVDGPPADYSTRLYQVQNTTYTDTDTVKMKKDPDSDPRLTTETQTSSMVILDDYEPSPQVSRRDFQQEQQEYETRSAQIKFQEESPEWESMDIQLRIDPTGNQDPVITRKSDPDKTHGNSSNESEQKFKVYDNGADPTNEYKSEEYDAESAKRSKLYDDVPENENDMGSEQRFKVYENGKEDLYYNQINAVLYEHCIPSSESTIPSKQNMLSNICYP